MPDEEGAGFVGGCFGKEGYRGAVGGAEDEHGGEEGEDCCLVYRYACGGGHCWRRFGVTRSVMDERRVVLGNVRLVVAMG